MACRHDGNNDGGTLVHAGFNMEVATWGTNLRTGNGKYQWTKSPAFEITAFGSYLFSIWMHEDGAMADRFITTSNEAYKSDK